jgi:hypothetical protein
MPVKTKKKFLPKFYTSAQLSWQHRQQTFDRSKNFLSSCSSAADVRLKKDCWERRQISGPLDLFVADEEATMKEITRWQEQKCMTLLEAY